MVVVTLDETKLTSLLKDAEKAHAEYERNVLHGVRDENWPAWYAQFIIAHPLNYVEEPRGYL